MPNTNSDMKNTLKTRTEEDSCVYDQAFDRTIQKLKTLCEEHSFEPEYMRDWFWKDYNRLRLDPDSKAVRSVGDIRCTGDALLSMQRICKMELNTADILAAYEKYRKKVIFFFPAENGGINPIRQAVFGDKIDYALADLKMHFSNKREECRLQQAYLRPKTSCWLKEMQSFERIVDWLGIRGIFTDENYEVIDLETGKRMDDDWIRRINKNWSQTYYQRVKESIDLFLKSYT